MAVEPKAFQKASIKVAVKALTGGSRRFLVADEVGLGKTVVASGVIKRLSQRKGTALTVFYVCSNSLLAHQNLGRLADFLPEEERTRAVSMVDRPSLMPTSKNPPDHPLVRLYSLSPGTAMAEGGGRVEERAFAAALLRKVLDRKFPGLEPGLRLSASKDRFSRNVRQYLHQLDVGEIGGDGLIGRFRKALREVVNLSDGQHLPRRLEEEMADFRSLASKLRAALAISALGSIKPDLVIFDEFQRFRDLLSADDEERDEENDAPAQVLRAIKGKGQDRPAILLLSATPYVPFRGRNEGGDWNSTADFFELIEFLGGEWGKPIRKRVESTFAELSDELRKGASSIDQISTLRRALEEDLRPLMCRTERSRAGQEASEPQIYRSEVLPRDIETFRGFAEALRETHPEWAVPLWSSVPLPMQSLGQRYTAWKRADWARAGSAVVFTQLQRDRLEPLEPLPHPRLRALLSVMPPRKLALPWIAPSRPWWTLGGEWAGADSAVDGKLLVFSRYRATPASIAGLTSYAVEISALRSRDTSQTRWETLARRRLLAASPDRPGLLALFHPCPFLVELDPLKAQGGTLEAIQDSMRQQLIAWLKSQGLEIVNRPSGEKRPLPWHLIAALERRASTWSKSLESWQGVISNLKEERDEPEAGTRLKAMLDRWNDVSSENLGAVDVEDVKLLADYALEAPGIALARALARHWPQVMRTALMSVAGACWRSLRAYLDNPVFSSILGGEQDDTYPDALRRAVRDGNLESVLDEHFWYVSQADTKSWVERLEAFEAALRLRAGSTSLHEAADRSFRLRCRAAMAMTEAQGAKEGDAHDKPVRPDEVRQAFNTPFWPHILVTTSVGQEGLDFHPWCRAVAHWDPPTGPVALEQREGRISRHAGLNVRRVLGQWAGKAEAADGASPWGAVARQAEAELTDETGLRPWWTADGTSNVQRILMSASGSEIGQTMSRLARERALYRLVLGMPAQGDLLALLMSRGAESIDPRLVCVNLMALASLADTNVEVAPL